MRVRISRRVQDYLSGTQDWHDTSRAEFIGPAASASMYLMFKIQNAAPRKDGSVSVELDPEEVEDLRVFNEAFAVAASQDHGPDALADWNAAQGLNRQIGPPDQ